MRHRYPPIPPPPPLALRDPSLQPQHLPSRPPRSVSMSLFYLMRSLKENYTVKINSSSQKTHSKTRLYFLINILISISSIKQIAIRFITYFILRDSVMNNTFDASLFQVQPLRYFLSFVITLTLQMSATEDDDNGIKIT